MNILKNSLAALALLLGPVCAEANQSNTWSPTTGTVSGLQLTTNYNNAFSAIQSCNSGATAPTNDQTGAPVVGQCWLNTSTTPNTVEMYSGSGGWVTVGWLDTATPQWIANDAGGTGTIASNTTTDLGTVKNSVLSISGTTTITGLGTTALPGATYYVNFTGILTLTHDATKLILPNGGLNITTAAGDSMVATALGSGNWRVVAYQSASGAALSANANITASIAFTGVISPTALTSGNNNDWNPTGLSTAETIRVTGDSGGGSVVTGLAGGATGRQVVLHNVGAYLVVVADNSASSTAANRFQLDRRVELFPDTSLTLRYDGTTSRWRVAGAPFRDAPLQGAFVNLKIANDSGAPTTTMDVTADGLTAYNPTTQDVYRVFGTSVAPVMTSSGANGLDTGSIVNNTITWYYVYVVINPTTATSAGLYSLATACSGVTLPAGYTYCVRVGAVRTDGAATARWMRTLQLGRRAQYVVTASSNTLLPPIIASGTAGTYSGTSPTLASVSIANFVPATASAVRVIASNAWETAVVNGVLVAPNTGWGGTNNGPQGSNGVVWPISLSSGNTTSGQQSGYAEFAVEALTIGWASGGSTGAIAAIGWEDNL